MTYPTTEQVEKSYRCLHTKVCYIRTTEETLYSCTKMKTGKPLVLKYKAQMQKSDIKALLQEQATVCFLLQLVLQQKRMFLKVR